MSQTFLVYICCPGIITNVPLCTPQNVLIWMINYMTIQLVSLGACYYSSRLFPRSTDEGMPCWPLGPF